MKALVENGLEKAKNSRYTKYIVFTLIYWIFQGINMYNMAVKWDAAAIGSWDAITQMYPVMTYTRRVLLEFFQALVNGEGFSFPMIEWSLGMGDNTISVLNWHGFGDPLYFFSVFVSEANLPYFYTFLFFLKIYLGGIAFLIFVNSLDNKKSALAYVVGAFIYCFTGFTVQCNMHIIFTHAMMFIPLMFWGAERVMNGKKRGTLLLSTFGFALCGFYFLYIGSISLAFYVIYRLISRRKSLQQAGRDIGTMLLEYIGGIGLSAFIFIPAVYGFLTSTRMSETEKLPLFMSWNGIKNFFVNIFLPQNQVLGVSTFGIFAVVLILFAKKRYNEKIVLALMLISCFIPYISCVMSGFGEVYDRWQVVYTMYIAYLTVLIWDELYELSWMQKFGACAVYLLMGIWGKTNHVLREEPYSKVFIAYGIGLFLIWIVLPIGKRIKKKNLAYLVSFICVMATVLQGWSSVARDREIDYIRERNVVAELIENEDSFYRIENERTFQEERTGLNVAFLLDYPGVAEYFSIENADYTKTMNKWNVSSEVSHYYVGLDLRAVLESLCSVKYLILRTDNTFIAPYGFEQVSTTDDKEWVLYQNKYVLPIAYVYEKVYDYGDYEPLNGFYKQQIMLQAAAVESYAGNLETTKNCEINLKNQEYEVTSIENGAVEDGVIKANSGTVLNIELMMHADCENYLVIKSKERQKDNAVSVVVEGDDTPYGRMDTSYDNGEIGVYLGTVLQDEKRNIQITFNYPMEIPVDDIQTMYYDFANYDEYINDLKQSVKNLAVTDNYITVETDSEEDEILCIAVPYSKGWSAKIDGIDVKIYKTNDMFMGIDLPSGKHVVELKFFTPGLKAGLIVTLCSAIGIVISMIIIKRGERHEF